MRLTFRLGLRLLASAGAVLAFLQIPVLYLLGTSYQDKLLSEFHIDPAQAPMAFDRAIYVGFKVALQQWAVSAFDYIVLFFYLLASIYVFAAMVEAFMEESDRATAKAKMLSFMTSVKTKLGWLGTLLALLMVIWLFYAALRGFVTAVGAGEHQATEDMNRKKKEVQTCVTKAARLPRPCVKVVHGDKVDIGVPITATDSLIFLLSGSSTIPVKTEDVSELSDLNRVPAPTPPPALSGPKAQVTKSVVPPSARPHERASHMRRQPTPRNNSPCRPQTSSSTQNNPTTLSEEAL